LLLLREIERKKLMKKIISALTNRYVGALALMAAAGQVARAADAIPYPTPHVENPITYAFTAAASGDVWAYFAGSTASFDNDLGMLINGVMSPNGFGLDNHSSALGLAFDLGTVTAGDSLVFVLRNKSGLTPPNQMAYSDPFMNGPYDGLGPGLGHNHVYSTPYTGTGPIIDSIPAGTFVSFEDLPAYAPPDWNYNDEDFVFTDVAVTTPDAASTAALLGAGLAGIGLLRRRLCS
jgi:hypothetical protein